MFKSEKSKYIMAICKDKLIIQNPIIGESTLKIEDLKITPCTPFYHSLWENDAKVNITGEFQSHIKSFVKNTLVCLFPDDSTMVDKKVIEEYACMHLNCKNIISVMQCQVLNLETGDLITVGQTNRCFVLNYLKDYSINKKIFFDKNSTIDEIRKSIYKLKFDLNTDDIPVFLNNINEDMNGLSELGTLVNKDAIINNSYKILDKLSN